MDAETDSNGLPLEFSLAVAAKLIETRLHVAWGLRCTHGCGAGRDGRKRRVPTAAFEVVRYACRYFARNYDADVCAGFGHLCHVLGRRFSRLLADLVREHAGAAAVARYRRVLGAPPDPDGPRTFVQSVRDQCDTFDPLYLAVHVFAQSAASHGDKPTRDDVHRFLLEDVADVCLLRAFVLVEGAAHGFRQGRVHELSSPTRAMTMLFELDADALPLGSFCDGNCGGGVVVVDRDEREQ